MPNPSNSDLVGEVKRLSEKVPGGPWTLAAGDVYQQTGTWLDDPLATTERTGKEGLAILEFIARARTLLPELAQQLEQVEQRLSKIRPLSDAERAVLYAQDDVTEQARRLSNAPGVINTTRDLDRALEKYDKARAALTPDEGADPGGR